MCSDARISSMEKCPVHAWARASPISMLCYHHAVNSTAGSGSTASGEQDLHVR